MRISIVGWYGMSNVGDEAFRCVIPKFFEGHELEFVTPPQKCNNPDIVILGGGAVASPFYLEILPDCPRYALGISIAYESEIDLLAKYNFKGIFCRNSTDIQEMRKKLKCPVDYTPDLAFLLEPTGNKILEKYRKQNNKKSIGVLASDYINPAIDRPIVDFGSKAWNFIQTMSKELDKLSKSFEVFLIPCSTGGYGDDRRVNLDFCAFMKNRPINIMDKLSPVEMIDLIAQLDATICVRFHAHIFSIIAGTPLTSIVSTRKVELLLEENGINNYQIGSFKNNEFEIKNLYEKIIDVTEKSDTSKYLEQSALNRAQLKNIIQKVRQEWLV